MLRALIFTIAFSSIAMMALAEDHKGRHPEFTAEQKACLTKILGEPGKGERPSHEKMDAAFSSCGIEKPKGPPPGGDSQGQAQQQQQENTQE